MKVQLNEQGYFTGNYAIVGDIDNSIEVESLPPYEYDSLKQQSCKLVDNSWVLDEEHYNQLVSEFEARKAEQQKQLEIAQLQKQLEDTDYKIIKCQEYSLAGLELPYDIEQLHNERQALRDKINELQEQ